MYTSRIHMVYYYSKISVTGLEQFWDDLKKKFRMRPGPTPPTHFHSKLGFFEFFSLQSPLPVCDASSTGMKPFVFKRLHFLLAKLNFQSCRQKRIR